MSVDITCILHTQTLVAAGDVSMQDSLEELADLLGDEDVATPEVNEGQGPQSSSQARPLSDEEFERIELPFIPDREEEHLQGLHAYYVLYLYMALVFEGYICDSIKQGANQPSHTSGITYVQHCVQMSMYTHS